VRCRVPTSLLAVVVGIGAAVVLVVAGCLTIVGG
jgi:hypothetical protein